MIWLRLSTRRAVTRSSSVILITLDSSSINLFKAILAKLHTAVSFSSEYSIISVHKLLLLIVPTFIWLLFLLTASLNKIYGVPVSIWLSRIFNHSSRAFTCFFARPSRSYLSYSSRKSSPYTSARPGHSSGQK